LLHVQPDLQQTPLPLRCGHPALARSDIPSEQGIFRDLSGKPPTRRAAVFRPFAASAGNLQQNPA
jgi:hypothetical protein